ncbi:MAG: LysM peptidoglycan-binding domain-containing protein, partial [Bacillota bacterium]
MQNNNKRAYEVQNGDTLWDIAEKELGDPNKWRKITKSDGSSFTEKEAKNLQAGEIISLPSITHRELLTFSNLTNLEWQFVDIAGIKQSRKSGQKGENIQSTTLNDLLSNPKAFVREYNDGEKEYRYGVDKNGDFSNKNKGLAEMRQEAGIAMEYLEKEKQDNEEGSFLKEWEVVYGADNYKVVKDYIDNLFEVLSPYFDLPEQSQEEKEDFYLSREEIAEAKQKKKFYEIGFKVFAGTLELIIAKKDLDGVTKKIEDGILSNVVKEISTNQLETLIAETDSIPLRLLAAVYFSQDSVLEMFQGATAGINKGYKEKFQELKNSDIYSELLERFSKEELAELESNLKQNVIAQINQKLTMSDTGFRVVVLKKDKNLVIAYKGSRPDEDKLLPEEFNHLQIVYSKMKREHSNCNISFTGYNAGADLGFLNTLFADEDNNATAKLFYSDIKKLQGYYNFTPHDINKSYQNNLQIYIESAGGITKEVASHLFTISLIAAGKVILDSTVKFAFFTNGLITLAVSALIWSMIETVKSLYGADNIQKIYDKLIELGFIEAEESLSLSVSDFSGGSETVKNRLEANKIKGFIQDKFIAAEYIPVEARTGETLKIKKADALYLLLTGKKPQKLKEDIYVIPYHQRGEYNLGLEKTEDDIYQINSRILPGVSILGKDPSPLLIEDKEELAQGQMLINLMKMIYKMQRRYKDKRKELFSFIYPTKDGVRVAKSVPPAEQLPEDLQASHNEYIFMPYIEKDGNINEIN